MSKKLVVLLFTAFVDMVGFIIIWPLLPYYAADMGATDAMVGLLISAFSVAQLLSAPVWGRFSDTSGRRPAILAGLIISSVAYVVFAYSTSIALLFVSRVVQGIGGGTIGVVQAYVADSTQAKDRAKALGWLSAATSLGAIVGPAIGSLLVRLAGRSAPGLGAALLCVAVAVFAWKFLEEPHREDSGPHTATHPATNKSAFGAIVSNPGSKTARLIWIYAIAIGGFYGTGALFPLLVAERFGVTEATIGYLVMYFGGMGLLVRSTILGAMVTKFGEARLCRIGIVLLAAGLALLGLARTWPMLGVAITLMPLGAAFTFPCVTALLTHAVRSRERGLYLGLQATFGGISRVTFPLLGGIVMDAFGRGTAYVAAGILVLGSLPLGLRIEDGQTNAPLPTPEGSATAAEPVSGSS